MIDHTSRAAEARKGTPLHYTREAAIYIGHSIRTHEKMRPRFRKHGRFVRYHIADLDAWSEGRRHSSTSDKGER